MSPVVFIGVALGLILVGLLMCLLCTAVKHGLLSTIVYYVGIILLIVGLILLVTPVLIWLNVQLRSALNV